MDNSPSNRYESKCPAHALRLGSLFTPLQPPQRDDPYPFFAQAQSEAPVFYSKVTGSWIATRYDDVARILKDTEYFSCLIGAPAARKFPPEVMAVLGEEYDQMLFLPRSDPPVHTRLRKFLNKAFTRRRMEDTEPSMRAHANELVDGFIRDGKAELLEQFVAPLTLRVSAGMQDIPEADLEQLKRWFITAQIMLGSPQLTVKQQVGVARDLMSFIRYYLALIEKRRASPGDDLVSAMVHARVEDEAPLTPIEMVSLIAGLNIGGNDTTTYWFGSTLRLLLQAPEQLAALRAEPARIPDAVEEALRMDTSVQGAYRIVKKPIELGGIPLEEGEYVFALLGAANRDAQQFPEPDHFALDRDNKRQHVAFGRGIHICSGAPLARIQGRISLEVLLSRLPPFRLQQGATVEYKPNLVLRGPKSIPVEWDTAAVSP